MVPQWVGFLSMGDQYLHITLCHFPSTGSAWPVKFLLWLGAIIGCFYIPAEYFSTYYIATYFFSALFIILQSMLLVGFAWSASASLLSKWEETGGSVYKFLLVGITAGSYLTVITFTVLLFVFFASNAGCDLNRFFIAFNLVWVLLLTGASILPKVQEANPRSGIFQAVRRSDATGFLHDGFLIIPRAIAGHHVALHDLPHWQCHRNTAT